MTIFSPCRHAAEPDRHGLRQCHSPKLAGLQFVTPQICEQCYCRDHEVDAEVHSIHSPDHGRPRLLSCAHLVEPAPSLDSQQANGTRSTSYRCTHPGYGTTTLQQCQHCVDYLYPLVTPRTPVDQIYRLIKLAPLKQQDAWWTFKNVQQAHRQLFDEVASNCQRPADLGTARGIVIVGGGKYFVSAYVTIRVLRRVGCRLPIELWHLKDEIDEELKSLLGEFGVRCRDGHELARDTSFRFLNDHWWQGWQLKAFALRNSAFREVLLLDSDCYPVRDPSFLFDWPPYRQTAAIFWPDLDQNAHMIPDHAWEIFGVNRWSELPTESGQMLINRDACWHELNLALNYNSHADFVYRILYGDKDTFPMAWHRLGRQYARMWPHAKLDKVALRQFDDHGDLLFIHRVHDKFRLGEINYDGTPQLTAGNTFHPQFPLEEFCFQAVQELADRNLKSRWVRTKTRAPNHSIRIRNDWDRQIVQSVLIDDEYRLRRMRDAGVEVRWALDVGSHIGSFVRLVKQLWPEARVICTEPDPTAVPYWDHNTAGFDEIFWHPIAVVSEGGPQTVRLMHSQDQNAAANFTAEIVREFAELPKDRKFDTVPADNILSLLEKHQFPFLDLVKLDCEGAEAPILEDLKRSGYLHRAAHFCGEWHYFESIPRIEDAFRDTHDLELYRHTHPWGAFYAKPR